MPHGDALWTKWSIDTVNFTELDDSIWFKTACIDFVGNFPLFFDLIKFNTKFYTYQELSCSHRNFPIRCSCIFFLPKLLAFWLFFVGVFVTFKKKWNLVKITGRVLFRRENWVRVILCVCLSITIWMKAVTTQPYIYKIVLFERLSVLYSIIARMKTHTHVLNGGKREPLNCVTVFVRWNHITTRSTLAHNQTQQQY